MVAFDSRGVRYFIPTLISLIGNLDRKELGMVAIDLGWDRDSIPKFISFFNIHFLIRHFRSHRFGNGRNQHSMGQRSNFKTNFFICHFRSYRIGNGRNQLGMGQRSISIQQSFPFSTLISFFNNHSLFIISIFVIWVAIDSGGVIGQWLDILD